MREYDVGIIGGGLAGLTAANFLAREGKKVVVFEKSSRLGGRGITNNKNGVLLNMGAHGLYIEGSGTKILTELGLSLPGKDAAKSVKIGGLWKNSVTTIPTDLYSILSAPLLNWKGKLLYSKLMLQLMGQSFDSVPHISLKEWAEKEIEDPMVRHIFYSICRLTTYTNAPMLQLAKPALKQVKRALKGGVLYIDGGWETIIQQLRRQAIEQGVDILLSKNMKEIEHHGDFQRLQCADGEQYDVSQCIVAIPPKEAMKMIKGSEDTSLRIWNDQSIPITASCLDIGLKELPNSRNQFALGLDQSLFFTNQSRAAKLSGDGTLVVSLVKYHNPLEETIDPQRSKEELETAMDLLHPNWRKEVVVQQFLPKITVIHDFPHLKRVENPGPAIPEIKGVFIAGDWVGHDEVLADAAIASGKRAALHIIHKDERIVMKGS